MIIGAIVAVCIVLFVLALLAPTLLDLAAEGRLEGETPAALAVPLIGTIDGTGLALVTLTRS